MANTFETIYSKTIQVNIKESTLSHRKCPIHLTIEQSSISTPLVQREVHIRLTDDKDPFFLYNLLITESDFLNLKQQLGLLVDFPAFPQQLIDLLDRCLEEQNKEVPKFLLTLTLQGKLGMDGGPGTLEVVEANSFRHLLHLSLRVCPASDQHIKKYLATCLHSILEERNQLQSRLATTEHELHTRTQKMEDKLKRRSQELEAFNLEMERKLGMQAASHREELMRQRETHDATRRQEETQVQARRNEVESDLRTRLHQAESQVTHLEMLNRDVQEKAQRCERLNKDQKEQLLQKEDLLQKSQRQLQELNKEKYNLELRSHELSQTLSQFRMDISNLETKLNEKDSQLERELNLNIRNAGETRKWDEILKEKQDIIAKRETEMRTLSLDLNTSNDLLRRVQEELKTVKSKIKLKDRVTITQEKSLTDTKAEVAEKEQRILSLTTCLNQKNDQLIELKEQVTKISTELGESNNKLRSKESVNRWLNKQLVDIRPQQTPLPQPQTSFRNGYIPGQPSIFSPITPPVPLRPPLYQSTAIHPRNLIKSTAPITPGHSIPSYTTPSYTPAPRDPTNIRHLPRPSTSSRPVDEVVS